MKESLKLSNGRYISGITVRNEVFIGDYYQLIKYIEDNGLRRI